MIVAVLSDVHGNLPALEAVLDDARQAGAERYAHLGDCLGYGPFPEQVVRRLRDLDPCEHIIGNYDRKVLRFSREDPKAWPHPKSPAKFFAFRWAWDQLRPESVAFLDNLPETRRVHIDGLDVVLTHGSPAGLSDAVDAATPPQRLAELAEMAKADVLLLGHTHLTLQARSGRTRFVNPGSVGRSEGGDPRAHYALLHTDPVDPHVTFRAVDYDVQATAAEVRRKGLPESFAQMFLKGRDLNSVIAELLDAPPADLRLAEGDARLDSVLHLAETCHFERAHATHVTFLALRLFDQLLALHGLGESCRMLLRCAGLLHDIGWISGQKRHHKVSCDLILQAGRESKLALDEREVRQVAAIARYHRRALPQPSHALYATLQAGDRNRVDVLGGMLRLADGLDRSHERRIQDVSCQADRSAIQIHAAAVRPDVARAERKAAQNKGDLLARALQREVRVRVVPVEP